MLRIIMTTRSSGPRPGGRARPWSPSRRSPSCRRCVGDQGRAWRGQLRFAGAGRHTGLTERSRKPVPTLERRGTRAGETKEQAMPTAVIVDAVRTAGGKRNGRLSCWHPADLAAEVLSALVERTKIDPGLVEDVITGCVMQAGAQSVNIARNAVLAAGWPEEVPATTIDRQCGSSQQAAHFAAQAVMAGAHDIVVASGVGVMSQVPMGASVGDG